MKVICYCAGVILSFVAGMALGVKHASSRSDPFGAAQTPRAYLVASWEILRPDELKPFAEAAMPLAQEAGLKRLASSEPLVLEGRWPYKGALIVQEYTSMRALLDFWRSADHEAAKKLREGRIDSHFVVAVEARR